MILEKGEMWSAFEDSDLWLFTANAHINKKQELTMGKGIALEVKERFPASVDVFGSCFYEKDYYLKPYGVYVPKYIPGVDGSSRIGAFQVKYHYRNKASLALIGYSVVKLIEMIKERSLMNVHLNWPGIGAGKLKRSEVLPIISELPDVVRVWGK